MRILIAIAISLFLQSVVTAMEALAGCSSLRIEPAMPMLVLVALAAPPLEGALLIAVLGLASDLMSLSPLGLHVLVFGILLFVARSLIAWLGLRSLGPMILLVLFVSVLSRLLLGLALLMFTEQAQVFAQPLIYFAAALLDALWLLFLRMRADDLDYTARHWGTR